MSKKEKNEINERTHEMDVQLALGVSLTGLGSVMMLVIWSKRSKQTRDRLDRGLRGYLAGSEAGHTSDTVVPQ